MPQQDDHHTYHEQRAGHTASEIIEALGDRDAGHTDCEQTDITHDVAEAADRIQERGKRTRQSGLHRLPEGRPGCHAAKQHDGHECNADTDEYGLKVDVLPDHQVQREHVHGNDGDHPSDLRDQRQVLLRDLLLDGQHPIPNPQSPIPQSPDMSKN